MPEVADLIRSIAWPAVAILGLLLFRQPVKERIGKIVHFRGPGIEADFERELNETAELVERFKSLPPGEEEQAPLLAGVGTVTIPSKPNPKAELEETKESIREAAAVSSRAALINVSNSLTISVRRTLAALGHYPSSPMSLPNMARELKRLGAFQDEGVQLVTEFANLRNRTLHDPDVPDEDALRAVEVGLDLLDTIERLPRSHHIVVAANLEVFADPEGRELRIDVRAVLLKPEHPATDGSEQPPRVFPTTKTHFEPGQEVAWEWGLDNHYDESWYRDPSTGEIKYGWRVSLEFVGRPLDWL